MAKLTPISGFPEWLPEQKLAEERIIKTIASVYASHGFIPIETPAVELIETLSSKGVVEREIYSVKRFHAEDEEESALGLHFDLTVPFARYVAQHMSKLSFPFKRYQMQKVWRGERPQKGRFREFYQFDIDTIARDELPVSCDAEILHVLLKAFKTIALGPFRMSVNNRKLLHGCYSALGLGEAERKAAIIAVDKLHKIGKDGVMKELGASAGVSGETAAKIIDLTAVQCSPRDLLTTVNALGIKDAMFEAGAEELREIFSLIPQPFHEYLRVDLSLARGLDYYTGIIFETLMTDFPEFGSVSSGGRYENLASQFTSQKLPGVGGSIGLTRLMELAFTNNLVSTEQRTRAQVLVTVLSEEQRPRCNELAEDLRNSGIAVEVFFKSPKLGKQIDFAAGKGIPYVLFVSEDGKKLEVKDLRTKNQAVVEDLSSWARSAFASE
jgi:histidyl-tRNA synthetase